MLTKDELAYAKEFLGKNPTQTELNMLDVLWSEHCSYKSSKRWFHHFKTQGDTVYLGIGEGAGLVDIGDGYLAGVAMESHNHPSQICRHRPGTFRSRTTNWFISVRHKIYCIKNDWPLHSSSDSFQLATV